MTQTSVAAPIHQPDLQDDDLLDPLWRLAGEPQNVRALIVADYGLDLMCSLIRRGCPAVTTLRPGAKPDTNDYDLIIIPHSAALPSQDHAIRLARRSLA